jgi:hypothetical protein
LNWWRAHNGISSDSKLAAIANRAKAKRAEVLAVWVSLLDFASQNDKRGSVSDLLSEDIGAQLELDEDLVQRIIEAMRKRGMILRDGMLAAWEKRNPGKTDDTNAERQRRYRERHPPQRDVTPSSNGVTALRNPEEKRREENTAIEVLTTAVESSTRADLARACPETIPEWRLLAVAVRRSFPQTDDVFVMRLAQACCSMAAATGKDCTDQLAADAVDFCSGAGNGLQTSAGLFMRTVPQTVKSWLTNGRGVPIPKKKSTSEIIHEAIWKSPKTS